MFFTQVCMYPVGRVLTVPLGFGKFDPQMLPLLDATLTQYAQIQDCGSIEIRGRLGWEKHFHPIGFKREAMVMTRRVVNMRIN